jgi:hypothetical protein
LSEIQIDENEGEEMGNSHETPIIRVSRQKVAVLRELNIF